MAIDANTMRRILRNVFDEMLDLTSGNIEEIPEASSDPRVVALICIFGQTKESLVVEAPTQTACLIAAKMFDVEPQCLSEEEVRDAIGEIANMICGNVKGTYEGISRLSMPCVSIEPGSSIRDGEHHTWISVAGEPLLVRWQELVPTVAMA